MRVTPLKHYDRPSRNGDPRHDAPPRDESEAPPDEFDCGDDTGNTCKPRPVIAPVSIGQMILDHPCLHEPVIDGLLRRGETANIIASPKVGKSWLAYGLAFSVVTAGDWLGKFPCRVGKVLIADNELHAPTIASRLAYVAKTLGLQPEEWQDEIDVLSLRGRLLDLNAIAWTVEALGAGRYSLVILDSLYRSLPPNTSENDNGAMAALYNLIDHAAEKAQTAWANIHHLSKGSQENKSISDLGAGAGAQSRAADAHIVLRPHEEAGVYVMEAVVRSFPPVEPLPLQWQYPLWTPASGVDPSLLKGRLSRSEEKAQAKDKAGRDAIVAALLNGPLTTRKLAAAAGMGKERLERLAAQLEREEHIESEETTVAGNASTTYRLTEEGAV